MPTVLNLSYAPDGIWNNARNEAEKAAKSFDVIPTTAVVVSPQFQHRVGIPRTFNSTFPLLDSIDQTYPVGAATVGAVRLSQLLGAGHDSSCHQCHQYGEEAKRGSQHVRRKPVHG